MLEQIKELHTSLVAEKTVNKMMQSLVRWTKARNCRLRSAGCRLKK
jgi:hypothetical protein